MGSLYQKGTDRGPGIRGFILESYHPGSRSLPERLLDNIAKLKETFGDDPEFRDMSEEPRRLVRKIAGHICAVTKKVDEMVEARKKANRLTDMREKAIAYHDSVAPYLDEIRDHIDDLELMVDNQMWPLPKYRELLFIR